jgi:hypothetical protein
LSVFSGGGGGGGRFTCARAALGHPAVAAQHATNEAQTKRTNER